MGNSSPPTDPLALGQHLVRELGIAGSTDTLARWLAHEVAEAMVVASQATTPRRRASARREAIELITSLWDHRAQLPGGANPLVPLREILGAASLFTEDLDRAWWGYRRGDDTEARVFRAFTRLMPLLLLLHGPSLDNVPGPGTAVYDHLGTDERAILDVVRDWLPRRTPERPRHRSGPQVVFVREEEGVGAGEEAEDAPEDGDQLDEAIAAYRASALDALTELEKGLATIRARLEAPVAADQSVIAPDGTDRDDE